MIQSKDGIMKRKLISVITLILLLASLLSSCHPVLKGLIDDIYGNIITDSPNCATCADSGFLECDICSGTTKITCKDCKGDGYIVCAECEGTGMEECYRCHGKGHFSPIFDTTHSSSLPSFCTTCWGSGESKTCPVVTDCECNEGIWYCGACNFSGKIDCPDC